SVRLERSTAGRPARARPARGPAFRRLQPVERRLPPQPPGDGRRPPGRDASADCAARPDPGLQLDPAHHAPPELPRAAATAPLVSARRAVARRAERYAAWRRRFGSEGV